eukprot:2540281-Pleurochrysis_carterae.AAC.1
MLNRHCKVQTQSLVRSLLRQCFQATKRERLQVERSSLGEGTPGDAGYRLGNATRFLSERDAAQRARSSQLNLTAWHPACRPASDEL